MTLWKLLFSVPLFNSIWAQDLTQCRCCNLSRVHPAYLKDLPSPTYRENIGKCHLKITTSSPEAQRWFDQGLTHLHGFWEFEAYRSFLEALKYDPKCVMAYWGIGMALPGKENEADKERTTALKIALSLQQNISAHEKLYLSVLQKLIGNGPPEAISELKKIMASYPDDTNAIAWYALWSNKGYRDGLPAPDTKQAIETLQSALAKKPNDVALNHYLIHLLEGGPHFEQARKAANSLSKIAPASGHLTHMPGHIHYLAGDYQLACKSFQQCDAIEIAYLTKEKIPSIDHKNYLHNLLYLVQAASDHGNYEYAQRIAKRLIDLPLPGDRLKASTSQINLYSVPIAVATPHIRAREFDRAATVLTDELITEKSPALHYLRILRFNCLAKSLLLKDGPLSDAQYQEAKVLIDQQSKEIRLLLAARPAFFAESQPLALAKKAATILQEESKALLDQAQLTEAGDFQLAWAYSAIFKDVLYSEPPILVTPVAETLGWCALSKKHPTEAMTFFKQALERRKKSGQIYEGLALASQQLGKKSDVQKYSTLAKDALFQNKKD